VDSKIVPVHAMKVYTESGDSPPILRSRSRWRLEVDLMPWPLYLPVQNVATHWIGEWVGFKTDGLDVLEDRTFSRPVFLNPRAAARYRALASIIPCREKFSWNLSF